MGKRQTNVWTEGRERREYGKGMGQTRDIQGGKTGGMKRDSQAYTVGGKESQDKTEVRDGKEKKGNEKKLKRRERERTERKRTEGKGTGHNGKGGGFSVWEGETGGQEGRRKHLFNTDHLLPSTLKLGHLLFYSHGPSPPRNTCFLRLFHSPRCVFSCSFSFFHNFLLLL